MFKDLVNKFKDLSTEQKKKNIIYEIKTLCAVFDDICTEQGTEIADMKCNEILSLKDGKETEDEFLVGLFIYLKYLKEVSSAAYVEKK